MSLFPISQSHFYFNPDYRLTSGFMSLQQYKFIFDPMCPKFTSLRFQRVACNSSTLGFRLNKPLLTPSVSLVVSQMVFISPFSLPLSGQRRTHIHTCRHTKFLYKGTKIIFCFSVPLSCTLPSVELFDCSLKGQATTL